MGTAITQDENLSGITTQNAPHAADDNDPATYVTVPEGSNQGGWAFTLVGDFTGIPATRIDVEWETVGGDCDLSWYLYLAGSGDYAEIGPTADIDLVAQPSGSVTLGDEHVVYDPSGVFAGGFSPATFLARVAAGDVSGEVAQVTPTSGFTIPRFQFVIYGGRGPRLRKHPISPLRQWPRERYYGRSNRRAGGYL